MILVVPFVRVYFLKEMPVIILDAFFTGECYSLGAHILFWRRSKPIGIKNFNINRGIFEQFSKDIAFYVEATLALNTPI